MKPICRKCDSTDQYTTEIGSGGGVFPNLLPLGVLGWLKNPKYRLNICGNCGLTEWFVAQEFLMDVKEKLQPVPIVDESADRVIGD